jgi:hypothetical protein
MALMTKKQRMAERSKKKKSSKTKKKEAKKIIGDNKFSPSGSLTRAEQLQKAAIKQRKGK